MTRVEPGLGCNHADGALTLVTLPYAFTQDDLLTSDEFLRRAKEYGHRLSLDVLQELHNRRLLVPLYRVSDTAVEGRRISVATAGSGNARGWVMAAAEGRLRDAAGEGYSGVALRQAGG